MNPTKIKQRERRSRLIRQTLYLAILGCAVTMIALSLSSAIPEKTQRHRHRPAAPKIDDDMASEELDPMPMLSADLIPWDNEAATDRQTSYQQKNDRGRVLIVRGILTIFSLGMDDLATKMRRAGYEVKVTTAAQSNHEARVLRDHVLSVGSNKPVIIIGHSLGGDKAPRLAKIFAEKSVPVDVLLMLDSTMPSAPPSNVRTCVNMYQNNGTPDWARVFRGTHIHSTNPQTRLINVDIEQLADGNQAAGINHFNIDANPWIHKVVIEMVGNLTTDPIERESSAPVRHAWQADQIPLHSQHSRKP